MYKYCIIALTILNGAIVNGALPGAQHNRTLTKADAEKLAILLGAGSVGNFVADTTKSEDQKKADEKFNAEGCPFAIVAKKGGLKVYSSNPAGSKPSLAPAKK